MWQSTAVMEALSPGRVEAHGGITGCPNISGGKKPLQKSKQHSVHFMIVTVSCPAGRLHVRITYGRLMGLCKGGEQMGLRRYDTT